MKRRSFLFACVVLCTLVAGVPVVANHLPHDPVAASAAASSDTAVSLEADEEPKILPARETVSDVLQREARALPGNRFAGISLDDDGQRVVHLTDIEGEPRPESIGGQPVQYETHSFDALKQAQTKLDMAAEDIQATAGIALAAWGVDAATNSLLVEVVASAGGARAATEALENLIPEVPITVVSVEGLPLLAARHNDVEFATAGWVD